jgi:hypothetical protein
MNSYVTHVPRRQEQATGYVTLELRRVVGPTGYATRSVAESIPGRYVSPVADEAKRRAPRH